MDLNFLTNTTLFYGTTLAEIGGMLNCLSSVSKKYIKDEFIYVIGSTTHAIGIVLSGSISIEYDDFWGNKTILQKLEKGEIFADTYACLESVPLQINVRSLESTEILFLDVSKILSVCSNTCAHHAKLIRNLLTITAEKNLALSAKIMVTTPKSIRGRISAYFVSEGNRQGGNHITLPFNRQQLADYLNVDRSALSNELSKLQKEGFITLEKNKVVLLESIEL